MQLTASPLHPVVQISAFDQILFAELIQAGSNNSNWLRPLFLVVSGSVWDLDLDADVLWKGAVDFAYAEDVLPLYSQAQATSAGRQLLQSFLKLACGQPKSQLHRSAEGKMRDPQLQLPSPTFFPEDPR